MKTILLAGFGAMGQSIFDQLKDDPRIGRWLVLERAERADEARRKLGAHGQVVLSADGLDIRPDFAVECAGHEVLGTVVPRLLEQGIDTIVASVGALALPGMVERLDAACQAGRTQLTLVPGALAGVDALAAARDSGLASVDYTGRKPPAVGGARRPPGCATWTILPRPRCSSKAPPVKPPRPSRRMPTWPPWSGWPAWGWTAPGSG